MTAVQGPTKVVRCIARMNIGGPAVQIFGLMTGLGPEYDQLLVYGECDETERDFLAQRDVNFRTRVVPELGRAIRPLDDVRAFLRLRAILKEEKPNILHTHTFKAGLVGRVAALTVRPRPLIVHTFHGHLLKGYFGRSITKIIVLIERLLAYRSDALVSVGRRVMSDLLEQGIGRSNKYFIVNPGVPAAQRYRKNAARAELGLPSKAFVIGFIGRLARIKRIDRFISALGLLNFEFNAVIVGDGPDRAAAEKSCSDLNLRVQFVGWQDKVDVLLSAMDLVVLTSDNEGTPLSLIEAQLYGVPVVSTNVGSVSDTVIEDSVTGFVTTCDASAVASAIDKIHSLPSDIYEAMCRTAADRAEKLFSYDRLCRDHRDIYRKLVSRR